MSQNPKKEKGQVIYFSHGGGPSPLLDDPSHRKMIDFMTDLPRRIHRPEAIVVFSVHWEENTVTGKAVRLLHSIEKDVPRADVPVIQGNTRIVSKTQ